MRIRRIAGALAALTVVAAATTACQDSRVAATGEGGKPKVTIMVGGLEKVIYLPAMLTQQLGNFAAQGIDVELQSEQSGANAVPRIVLASLFVIWFGLGLASKVATVVVLVFFVVFFNAFTGAREVDRNLIDNARILGAGRMQVMKSIVLPSATSWILSSLHTAFGFALIGAVVGEYAGSKAGIGFLISNAQGTFDSAGIYAAMIIITVVALFAEWGIGNLENRLLRWRPSMSATSVKTAI
jgi:ABC-type proline/glycine betaine transport system permease subunit